MKLKFQTYVYEDTNEEPAEHAEEICDSMGLPLECQPRIEAWLNENPFYEVEFDVELDTETDQFEIVACRSVRSPDAWELVKPKSQIVEFGDL